MNSITLSELKPGMIVYDDDYNKGKYLIQNNGKYSILYDDNSMSTSASYLNQNDDFFGKNVKVWQNLKAICQNDKPMILKPINEVENLVVGNVVVVNDNTVLIVLGGFVNISNNFSYIGRELHELRRRDYWTDGYNQKIKVYNSLAEYYLGRKL